MDDKDAKIRELEARNKALNEWVEILVAMAQPHAEAALAAEAVLLMKDKGE